MPLIMPILNTPAQRYRVDLDGTRYLLRLVWHPRLARWTMDLGLPGATQDPSLWIARGISLVRSFFLLSNVRDPRRPTGEFLVRGGRRLGDLDFDALVSGDDRLHYFSRAELVRNADGSQGIGPDPDPFTVSFA